ncbi:hypothetical protein PVA45_04665 [Entomospira entomophila]|uniref:Uncharacterized protein n=1 Tax=Entomospira entomophila TaxID=2719988 RepID=A0A968GD51_9SPIO|nr:hypothetical protein [Entomospira entomophilus]NIZ40794.1 hypothetical protein [Entomospira entomophilus]WDI35007.1 hypothetical protein PVA45_04665 [Entomospira entomophilus]
MTQSKYIKMMGIALFSLLVIAMFSVSAYGVWKFDGYHARVLFLYNDVQQQAEGVILPQKRQQSVRDEIDLYLFTLLSNPLNANYQAIFHGNASVDAVYMLPHNTVVVLYHPDYDDAANTEDISLVERGLEFNFPQVAPFTIVLHNGSEITV